MKYLFFIQAPFQIISAMEIVKRESVAQNNVILIRRKTDSLNNEKQIQETINLFSNNIGNVYTFEHINKPLLLRLFYFKLFVDNIKKCFKQNELRCFVGDYENEFLKNTAAIFNDGNIEVIDDGISSLSVVRNWKAERIIPSLTKKYLKHIVYKTLGISNQPNTTGFISMVDLEKYKSETCNLNFVYINEFTLFDELSNKSDSNDVWILGAKFIDIGFLTPSDYKKYLLTFIEQNTDKNITYIPHRDEDSTFILGVLKRHNVKALFLDIPLEVHLASIKVLPSTMVSFYSAALFTVSKIFKEINVLSIYIEADDFKCPEYIKFNIKEAYNLLDEQGIIRFKDNKAEV